MPAMRPVSTREIIVQDATADLNGSLTALQDAAMRPRKVRYVWILDPSYSASLVNQIPHFLPTPHR